jgi:hypothetical protein
MGALLNPINSLAFASVGYPIKELRSGWMILQNEIDGLLADIGPKTTKSSTLASMNLL